MAGNGERWRGGGNGKGAKGQPARHERRPPADPPEASFHGQISCCICYMYALTWECGRCCARHVAQYEGWSVPKSQGAKTAMCVKCAIENHGPTTYTREEMWEAVVTGGGQEAVGTHHQLCLLHKNYHYDRGERGFADAHQTMAKGKGARPQQAQAHLQAAGGGKGAGHWQGNGGKGKGGGGNGHWQNWQQGDGDGGGQWYGGWQRHAWGRGQGRGQDDLGGQVQGADQAVEAPLPLENGGHADAPAPGGDAGDGGGGAGEGKRRRWRWRQRRRRRR